MNDPDDDFGDGPEPPVDPDMVLPASWARTIPFARQKPTPGIADRWSKATIAYNKKNGTSFSFESPLQAAEEMERKLLLPPAPLPPDWSDFANRCKLFPGEMMGISGPTGGGKTSFAIQICRIARGLGMPILWNPLELDSAQVNLRAIANMAPCHMWRVRDSWTKEDRVRALIQVNDLWHYVPKERGWAQQVKSLRAAIQITRDVYGRAPLFVIDYIGKLARNAKDARGELADSIEALREMTLEEECYGILLSQTSRGNNALLTGKVDIDSAADAIGVSAETAELEHAVANNVGLCVFKQDDAEVLDAHVLVTKARNTGREGRVGFQFQKPGGKWIELAHLPPTPNAVTREVAARKKDSGSVVPPDPIAVRQLLNAESAQNALGRQAQRLERYIRGAGYAGLDIRKVGQSIGSIGAARAAAQELVDRGIVDDLGDDRFRAR